MPDEPQGCLFQILRILGMGRTKPEADQWPFQLRDDFLSPAEISFYFVLCKAVGDQFRVLSKVRLADVVFVSSNSERQRFQNKIQQKHIDFLLCDSKTMAPRCAVELDDRSHRRAAASKRDEEKDRILAAAGLPVLRVPAAPRYSPADLMAQIESAIGPQADLASPPAAASGVPNCPKCGVSMVRRRATKGAGVGTEFWGCPNYPKCRAIIQA